jgi:hypothetical protein
VNLKAGVEMLRLAVGYANLLFENERLKGRIRYLISVRDASRLDRMRLAEENVWLRELAGIAPGAEVKKPPKQLTTEAK